MTLSQRFRKLDTVKFAFGKQNEFAEIFAIESDACSMFAPNFGLGIPSNLSSENQIRGVFNIISQQNGIFLFNISGVDLLKARKGFTTFDEAADNNQITEWELFMILSNKDYLKSCTFHNGKVKFKKRILWKSIMM